jgi:hypothetical protein
VQRPGLRGTHHARHSAKISSGRGWHCRQDCNILHVAAVEVMADHFDCGANCCSRSDNPNFRRQCCSATSALARPDAVTPRPAAPLRRQLRAQRIGRIPIGIIGAIVASE